MKIKDSFREWPRALTKNFTGIIEFCDGFKWKTEPSTLYFFKDGLRHREGKPAILSLSSDEFWYLNNNLHREDGPARILVDEDTGKIENDYFLNGIRYSLNEWNIELSKLKKNHV
jgi:hypothetical protein